MEDEYEVHIQLIERKLHKFREEIQECKMNQTTHNNTNDSQHDCLLGQVMKIFYFGLKILMLRLRVQH